MFEHQLLRECVIALRASVRGVRAQFPKFSPVLVDLENIVLVLMVVDAETPCFALHKRIHVEIPVLRETLFLLGGQVLDQ